MHLPRIIIAGTHSGVGKTTLTMGIISALRKKGVNVQAFKTGPDYIDPAYHVQASGRACGNLDSWLLSKNAVIELFARRSKDSDISIIEGVMGLYDGLKASQRGSTAHLAKMLKCPVILILNAHSLSRSAAAIALGYQRFDPGVDLAGIILNNIAGSNHYHYIKSAIEKTTRIPVIGCLPRDPNLKLSERHLGLVPALEKKFDPDFHNKLAKLVNDHINLAKLLAIGRQAKPLPHSREVIFKGESFKVAGQSVGCSSNLSFPRKRESDDRFPIKTFGNDDVSPFTDRLSKPYVTIAIAKDEAFNFYYQDNLDILSHLGAEIVTFSPLRDRELPKGVDGLYIGGGFPELFASDLSKNKSLKQSIYQKAKYGLPIYAECGGLMYLVKSLIDFKKRKFPMLGIFKCSVKMGERLQRMGYVKVQVVKDNILGKQGDKNRAHLFHWSRLAHIPKSSVFAYKITKDKDNLFYDGLITRNVLASYAHLHFAANRKFAGNFINRCREFKINHA